MRFKGVPIYDSLIAYRNNSANGPRSNELTQTTLPTEVLASVQDSGPTVVWYSHERTYTRACYSPFSWLTAEQLSDGELKTQLVKHHNFENNNVIV